MYSLFRLLPLRRLLQEQVPALGVSFIVAELFYKFHSFTLETLAFLATWGLVDAVIQAGRHVLRGTSDSAGRFGALRPPHPRRSAPGPDR